MDGDRESVRLQRSEWNLLVVESVVLSGLAMAAVIVLGRRLAPAVPYAVWFGAGLLAVPLVGWPVLSVTARHKTGRTPSVARLAALAVLASVAGAVIQYVLR